MNITKSKIIKILFSFSLFCTLISFIMTIYYINRHMEFITNGYRYMNPLNIGSVIILVFSYIKLENRTKMQKILFYCALVLLIFSFIVNYMNGF